MKTEELNNALIRTMREKVPKGMNLANMLMDTICIGKEAVYRRLRSEVPFTFAEIAVIAKELDISLDLLIGKGSTGNALFDLCVASRNEPFNTFYEVFRLHTDILRKAASGENSVCAYVTNMVPQTFFLKYNTLTRFRMFKWLYQQKKIDVPFKEMVFPEGLETFCKDYTDTARRIENTYHILHYNLFDSLISDIRYFAGVGIIDTGELESLKADIFALIAEMEKYAVHGAFENGNRIEMYVSNINIDSTFGYVQSSDYMMSLLKVSAVNSIKSTDANVLEMVKEWIDSMKKFTTLISRSGEIQRVAFFKHQRAMAADL